MVKSVLAANETHVPTKKSKPKGATMRRGDTAPSRGALAGSREPSQKTKILPWLGSKTKKIGLKPANLGFAGVFAFFLFRKAPCCGGKPHYCFANAEKKCVPSPVSGLFYALRTFAIARSGGPAARGPPVKGSAVGFSRQKKPKKNPPNSG